MDPPFFKWICVGKSRTKKHVDYGVLLEVAADQVSGRDFDLPKQFWNTHDIIYIYIITIIIIIMIILTIIMIINIIDISYIQCGAA